jgi:hypothetical protein
LARSKGSWSATYNDKVELNWDNNTYLRTINLDESTNIAAIHSSPGSMCYRAFHALHEVTADPNMPVCFNTQVVTNDEESSSDSPSESQSNDALVEGVLHQYGSDNNQTTIDLRNKPVLSGDKELGQEIAPTAELLYIHQRLSHLLFKSIQLMTVSGHYSKRLAGCPIPQYSACLFG